MSMTAAEAQWKGLPGLPGLPAIPGFHSSGGTSGTGWSGGYWNGSKLVPGTYPKNGMAWGSLGYGQARMGAGFGYRGGGVGFQAPGSKTWKVMW